MTVRELKGLLAERGLPISGKKSELVERLSAADAESSGGEGAEDTKKKQEKADADKEKEQASSPQPPFGSTLPDPHEGKPETILDDEGRLRYLCLDGQYRRGDCDSIECKPENFQEWLTEWVVAARTGQLEGQEQKTFFPDEDRESNPKGKLKQAGKTMKSEEVLVKVTSDDERPRWDYKDPDQEPPEPKTA